VTSTKLADRAAVTHDHVVVSHLVETKPSCTDFGDEKADADFSLDAVFVSSQNATLFGGAGIEQLISPRGVQSG